MSKEEIVALAIRLLAIFLVFYLLRQVPATFVLFAERDSLELGVIGGGYGLLFLAALLLWKFPNSWAKWIVPYGIEGQKTSWNSRTLVATGSTLLGMYFLYYAGSDLLYWAMVWNYNREVDGMAIELTAEQRANFVVTVVELLVAILLVVGAKSVSNAVHFLRYGGTPPSNK